MTNEDIEQEIQAKGLTAPRVTPADIEANIASEHYFTGRHGVHGANDLENRPFGSEISDGRGDLVSCFVPEPLRFLTFCVLVLRNGFTVTGESFCRNPLTPFNPQTGRELARRDAVEKLWPLMWHALKQKLYDEAELLAGLPLACDPKNPV